MKTFKYSTIVTLVLTVLSAIAIFAIDDIIPDLVVDPFKSHILNNLDNYNSFLFGIFTGSLVSLIVAIVSYATERRRLIAEIWNNARKLNVNFKLLLLDNIDYNGLTPEKLIETVEKQAFNRQVREWLSFYSASYLSSITQLDFLFNRGKTIKQIKAIDKNVDVLKSVADSLMNAFLNKQLNNNYGVVEIENVFKVISYQDEEQVIQTMERQLDDLLASFNKNNIRHHMNISRQA